MADPRFPLYIPSRGRYQYMKTSRYLDKMNVPHRIVCEPYEYKKYLRAVDGDKDKILVLDMSYKDKYDYCDDRPPEYEIDGHTVGSGSGPARNFIWDHSISEGHPYHWIMDDNITAFLRTYKVRQYVRDGTIFALMEEFVLRYKNVAMAGPNYDTFVQSTKTPFTLNSRIYSCNLIRNDLPFRWRGRWNEDTILSLDMLYAGWCTVLFNAFLQRKMVTQAAKGGNTDTIYQLGTAPKSKMLYDLHPEVTKVVWRFGRVHHYVDYGKFKNQKLIRRDDAKIKPPPKMRLIKVADQKS